MIMRSLRRAGRILAKILDSKIQGIILKMFRFAQHDNEKAGLESRPTRICNEKAGVPCTWAAWCHPVRVSTRSAHTERFEMPPW